MPIKVDDESGCLMVVPRGDVLFSQGHDPSGGIYLVISDPQQQRLPGELANDLAGKKITEHGAKVAIKLSLESAVVLLESLSMCMVSLMGMPQRESEPKGGGE